MCIIELVNQIWSIIIVDFIVYFDGKQSKYGAFPQHPNFKSIAHQAIKRHFRQAVHFCYVNNSPTCPHQILDTKLIYSY